MRTYQRLKFYFKGKIAMLRYGFGFRGDKVANAQKYGAIGAILFSDPGDVAVLGINQGLGYMYIKIYVLL